ncbi:ABC transporter permease subunit [Microbacterium sp. cx-55]|uniref:ABC transporter permease n=1 Tax=unclassified Microbacterium TaxID=2609290 RepID=UPI001CBE0E42|nr:MULTISPECIES: ABC transporter permease subunit [unclassified Microbacterium]MBZ4487124.1 ABC transporter permease subunit [Microbacterium sp. cx-55]MCC4908749.1 ABC transporter permease subunit [Microbacterium sp. cx-59]UGB35160.1 ABC transporter permease subunit [Microbacterium sp. cx-55]
MNLDWIANNAARLLELTGSHLLLSVIPVVVGLIVALPLGWVAQRSRVAYPILVGASSLLYTVPSLALFVLLPQILHTRILDPLNVVVALSVYTVALLVRVVADGLSSVPYESVQAAEAMGYRSWQRLLLVQLPAAVPVIGAGLRVAVVANVSIVSMAALLGIPQLGSLFTQGFQLRLITPVILGIVLSVVLAVLLDLIVIWITKRLTPWRRTDVAA